MSEALKQKLYLTSCVFILTLVNFLLIDTRLNVFGIMCGGAALVLLIKSLLIQEEK